ncbi:MAG: signal peptidase II [Bryobacteraceae bacterium]
MTAEQARLIPFALSSVVFAADRLTKVWIVANLSLWDVIPVIPGLFNIIHSENTGMAFSLLQDAPEAVRTTVLIGFAGAVLCVVAWMLWKAETRWQRIALALVLGGALGNLYDRIVRGSVTDFLDVFAGTVHWPTFNVADSAITVGALMIVFELLRSPAPKTAPSCSPK